MEAASFHPGKIKIADCEWVRDVVKDRIEFTSADGFYCEFRSPEDFFDDSLDIAWLRGSEWAMAVQQRGSGIWLLSLVSGAIDRRPRLFGREGFESGFQRQSFRVLKECLIFIFEFGLVVFNSRGEELWREEYLRFDWLVETTEDGRLVTTTAEGQSWEYDVSTGQKIMSR